MIVYATHKGGRYLPIEESLREQPEGTRNIYVNLTNRCNCACTFCLRNMKEMVEEHSLWLKQEPTVAEVEKKLEALPWDKIAEVVFCGFGEPTLRLDALVELLHFVKENYPEHPTRLNTNGLSELEYGHETASVFRGILDTVSISLNAATAKGYYELTRAKYGVKSYEGLLTFAEHCKAYVPHVVLTIVDHVTSPEDIEKCRGICESRGLTLRVRPYEDS
ncbi:MAG: radical SAM protein [Selenomonas sp.]|nr:radical SAM protein [Selenomonas sp.]